MSHKVLILEDRPRYRELTLGMARSADRDAIADEAATVAAAKNFVQEHPDDIAYVIVDLLLSESPDESSEGGKDFVLWLLKRKAGPRYPILVLSSFVEMIRDVSSHKDVSIVRRTTDVSEMKAKVREFVSSALHH